MKKGNVPFKGYNRLFLLLTHPTCWFNFIYRILKGLRTRIRVKIWGMYSLRWYPSTIRKVLENHAETNESILAQSQFETIFTWKKLETTQFKKQISILATQLELEQYRKEIESPISSEDEEFKLALHRFQFIPQLLSNGASVEKIQWISLVIKTWSECHKKDNSGYSVSERLVNFVIFNCISSKLAAQHCLVNNIKNDLNHLKTSLEYPASGIINNHILNNARALYIAGSYISDQQAINLGREILKLHLKDMVSASGVLLENSTHYQLMLTKNMLEVSLVALAVNDHEFYLWISQIVNKMLKASLSFKPKGLDDLSTMPWIGDISPDIKTDWFDPTFRSGGWINLWQAPAINDFKENQILEGWNTIQTSTWFAITNTHQNKMSYPAGHGHEDWGSFCLYYQGTPVLVDPGRSSYDKKNKDIFAHNHLGILHVGNAAAQKSHGVFSSLSILDFKSLKFSLAEDPKTWVWSKTNLWQRKVIFSNESQLHIEDEYLSSGNYQVVFPLSYLAKIERLNEHELLLEINQMKFKVSTDKKLKLELEQYLQTINYGVTEQAYRIIVNLNSINEVRYIFQYMGN